MVFVMVFVMCFVMCFVWLFYTRPVQPAGQEYFARASIAREFRINQIKLVKTRANVNVFSGHVFSGLSFSRAKRPFPGSETPFPRRRTPFPRTKMPFPHAKMLFPRARMPFP
jgi:hypothetical protein